MAPNDNCCTSRRVRLVLRHSAAACSKRLCIAAVRKYVCVNNVFVCSSVQDDGRGLAEAMRDTLHGRTRTRLAVGSHFSLSRFDGVVTRQCRHDNASVHISLLQSVSTVVDVD